MSNGPIGRVTPTEAWQLLQNTPGAVLIDVRSRVEHDYVGHPPDAIPIPWKEFPDWQVNADFVAQVRAALIARGVTTPEQTPICALCRSGGRSLAAGEELLRHGFEKVWNIEEGFEGDRDADGHRNTVNGWRARGLPWEQT